MGTHQQDTKKVSEHQSNKGHRILILIAGLVAVFHMAACSPMDAPQDTGEATTEALLGAGAPVLINAIMVNSPGSDMFVAVGDTLQLTAEVNPEQENQPEFSWSIETGPARVDQTTGQVTITGYGKILVCASVAGGSGIVGDAVLVGVPKAPAYTIDYEHAQTAELIQPAHEYSTDGGSSWVKGSGTPLHLTADQRILFRVAAAGSVYAGKVQTLVATRPEVPPAPLFTIDAYNDQTNQILTDKYEYSSDGTTWLPGENIRLKLVNGQKIRIRAAEAGLIPASTAQVLAFIKLPEHYFNLRGGVIIDYNPAGGKNVVIPDAINSNAFSNTSLSQVTIPDTVTDIGRSAFYGLSQDKIKLGKGFASHFLTEEDTIIGMICSPNANLIIPGICNGKTITKIGYNVFYGKNLDSVTFPATLKEIGAGAFELNRLKSVAFPEGLERIENQAFSNNMLTSLSFSATLKYIGYGAFSQPNDIKKIVMKGSDATVSLNVLSQNSSSFELSYLTYGKGTYTADSQVGHWTWSWKTN
ncbi:MAG: leucine-rich repeat domain-containing protein [Anaerolineaceae bacterium]|nr:leucine-rich repeat domain-containing protein [Anaerolineaceae bacterium]